ncbi:MAG: SagB/ThcOx family dehydrogenase [Gammaproteobacteria bacterium]|nr:SagB/ThcOx family dehydrogenase [Gammaproteobacteria bacterium]
MDWQNQPNPFRFYKNSKRLDLPLITDPLPYKYASLYVARSIKPQPLNLSSIARFLELSLGLSAWKQYGASEWSLRMNPSSGNLHPTECYLLLPGVDEFPASIAHYNPLLHCLEIRYRFDDEEPELLRHGTGFGVVLTSIFWREAWKYGERAFRYTQHDIGHALGALRFSAALQGWGLRFIPEVPDGSLDRILGLTDDTQVPGETERADCLCWVSNAGAPADGMFEGLSEMNPPTYLDTPNRLSPSIVDWPVIEEAAKMCESPGYRRQVAEMTTESMQKRSLHNAETVIRQRRSAQAFDPRSSSMDFTSFREILTATLPTAGAPFDVLARSTNVHLFLFVHRVEGLESGLYGFIRNAIDFTSLNRSCSGTFLWQRVEKALPLYLLQPGDYTAAAESVSCHQAIAGDSAFSLGMLARFDSLLTEAPWMYPNLFWEAGLIGQVLYLEAEDKGFRGTGIGCYFDDVMHQQLGMTDKEWQDVYHFTIGMPVEDQRLQTKPPYHHLTQLRGGPDD